MMRAFLHGARTATRWALVAFVVSIPGCAQIDFSIGPGVTPDPTPAWAVPLVILGFLSFFAVVVLVPSRVVVRVALFVMEGRSTSDRTNDGPVVVDEPPIGGQLNRLLLVGALLVLIVGVGLSVDTNESDWVFPDPDLGWIGIPLLMVGFGLLIGVGWRWLWPESQIELVGKSRWEHRLIAAVMVLILISGIAWLLRPNTASRDQTSFPTVVPSTIQPPAAPTTRAP